MQKINVIGTSGSGKSTFSRALAQTLNLPYLEMDALYWRANWQEPSDEEFFSAVKAATAAEAWVLDGNYSRTQAIKWRDIDTIIWLDFSFTRTMWQAVTRALSRIRSGQELWPNTGNVETWRLLLSRHSIVLWTLRCYRKNKTRYAALMYDPSLAHIRFVRLHSPKECQAFIAQQAPTVVTGQLL